MDSHALGTFLAVYEEGGVSAAALKLGRTQSAISRRIALLEDQLGIPLFERIGKSMVLSQAGTALLPHARRVTAAVEDAATAVLSVASGGGGTLRLVCVGTLADAELTERLSRIREVFPGCDVRLQTATSDEVSSLVQRGAADIGLRYHEDPLPELNNCTVWQEELVIACSPRHHQAGANLKSLRELSAERWLAFPNDANREESYAATIFAQFRVHNMPKLNWLPVDSLTAQKRLVEADFGIAMLQESAIAEELSRGAISTVNVRGLTARIPVVLVRRKEGFLGGAGKAFCEGMMHKADS